MRIILLGTGTPAPSLTRPPVAEIAPRHFVLPNR
jgi:hypothetical protein